MAEYDYIVVGGGSSGCVVASRLSENPSTRVLLIESGGRDDDRWIGIPATFFKVIEKGVDVKFYRAEPSKALNGRETIVPQGHVIGGGSSVNAMIYIRGQAHDYNLWAQMGNRGWSYDDVLPVFRDLENNAVHHDQFHGDKGDLHVSDKRFAHPLCEAFVKAAQEAGLPYNPDFNGNSQEGVGFYQTTTHQGRRWSAAKAFLRKAEARGNLAIRTNSRVARITFEKKRCTGVELEDGTRIAAGREVVLCSGAIETPRLLQLSGIGNAKELRGYGIDVVADLRGVGENYQDHMESTVQGETHDPMSILGEDKGIRAALHMLRYLITKQGLLTSNVVECGGFADVSGAGLPDIQFHVLPFMVGWIDRPPTEKHGIAIGPCYLRPKSRGSVKLRSNRPQDPALFDAGVFRDEDDLDVLARGVRLGIKILEMPSLARLVKRRALPEPGIEKSDKALRDYVRQTAKTVFHPSGTAKMGPSSDKSAVVDAQLRVHGVKGLRVGDASIMPTLVSGNTNAPTMMIGERCARFIMGRETLAN
jgi:choline dehydrogenase-like flavoprotein